jgi:hypothetical protein
MIICCTKEMENHLLGDTRLRPNEQVNGLVTDCAHKFFKTGELKTPDPRSICSTVIVSFMAAHQSNSQANFWSPPNTLFL